MVPGLVRAGDELALPERFVGNHLDRDPDRADRARIGAEGLPDLVLGRGSEGPTERLGHLALVEAVVSPDEAEHDLAFHDNGHRLRRRCRIDAQELRDVLDRRHAGSLHRLRRVEPFRELGRPGNRACDLEVGRVVAPLARDERVLTGLGRRKVIHALATAHHPDSAST